MLFQTIAYFIQGRTIQITIKNLVFHFSTVTSNYFFRILLWAFFQCCFYKRFKSSRSHNNTSFFSQIQQIFLIHLSPVHLSLLSQQCYIEILQGHNHHYFFCSHPSKLLTFYHNTLIFCSRQNMPQVFSPPFTNNFHVLLYTVMPLEGVSVCCKFNFQIPFSHLVVVQGTPVIIPMIV